VVSQKTLNHQLQAAIPAGSNGKTSKLTRYGESHNSTGKTALPGTAVEWRYTWHSAAAPE
jgi:hypothetical protein